jgi:hypothetical protein
MSGLKGTFFDSFIPSESEEVKPLKSEDGADDIDTETGQAAKTMSYSDLEEEEEIEEELEEEEESEEESEEEEEENTPEPEESDAEDLDDEPLAELINALAEEGALSFDPEKEYSTGADGFREVVQETIEKEKNKWVEEIPEDYRSIINHLKAGRSLDEWVDRSKTPSVESVDLDDESSQKDLISRHLRSIGMDDEDIEIELEKAEDTDDLGRKAKVAHKFLLKKEKEEKEAYQIQLTKEAEEREKEVEKAEEYLKETIFSLQDLGGFKLDKKKQQELYDHIAKPVTKDGKTKLMLNQSDPKKQLLAAYLDMLDYNFKDVEKIAATKVSRGLNQALSRVTSTAARRTGGKGVREPKQSIRVPKGIWDSNREVED